jgi:ABC-2 type transport system permease protein
MTIVGPVLMAALFIAPVWFAMMEDDAQKVISVYDETGTYRSAFTDSENLKFNFTEETDREKREDSFLKSGNYALLTIYDKNPDEYVLFSEKTPDISVKEQVSGRIEGYIEAENFKRLGISKNQIDSAKTEIYLETYTISEAGIEKSSAEVPLMIGFAAAIIIYMFIFLYGVQVMRGVIEEKVNRVVEVLISSVKPFQLMAGKIIGIAMVALTQFLLWGILTLFIVGFVYFSFGADIMPQNIDAGQFQNISSEQAEQILGNSFAADTILGFVNFNWTTTIISFLIFFIGGYLLYASLFAAIGSAVDNETDTQQFMLPVTIPLILAFVASQGIIRNPDGAMAFWFSIIPLTSPIVMPIRVALERYEIWELVLSGSILILSFIASVWLAAKIYRTGILMYGKKVSYKELWKWLRYR